MWFFFQLLQQYRVIFNLFLGNILQVPMVKWSAHLYVNLGVSGSSLTYRNFVVFSSYLTSLLAMLYYFNMQSFPSRLAALWSLKKNLVRVIEFRKENISFRYTSYSETYLNSVKLSFEFFSVNFLIFQNIKNFLFLTIVSFSPIHKFQRTQNFIK